jgi:hypothetical protein
VRHSFHFLFASSLLLGFCIFSNVQKSEDVTQLSYHPDILQEKLQAESSIRSSAELVPFIANMAPAVFTTDTEKPDQLEYQISEASMVRSRTQRLIYLELKPLLIFRSGQYFHFHRSSNDPARS